MNDHSDPPHTESGNVSSYDNRFRIVIPSRFGSSRLPGKPLRLIAGQPMIYHVYQNALRSGAEEVLVATDDERIRRAVVSFGGKAIMTSPDHVSGTDRIAEVVTRNRWDDDVVIVNLQGDEPTIGPELLRLVADALYAHPRAGIATVATPLTKMSGLTNPNVVKVVTGADEMALYFSRAPIPWVRDLFREGAPKDGELPAEPTFLRHLGLYAYRGQALARLTAHESCAYERAEALEQLRAISLGIGIHVSVVSEAPAHGVDTEEDLLRMEEQFEAEHHPERVTAEESAGGQASITTLSRAKDETAGGWTKTHGVVANFSYGIARIPNLEKFLNARKVVHFPSDKEAVDIDCVVGWGKKALSEKAHGFADTNRLPFVHLEDGFLRSVDLGVSGEPALSMILDDQGVYYDATAPSRLEEILNGNHPLSALLDDSALKRRAGRCIRRIVDGRLSKYNHAPVNDGTAISSSSRRNVLVVDQTFGDMSIRLGLVPPDGFKTMVRAALEEHPDAEVLIKTHPDVVAGKKRGCVSGAIADPRVHVVDKVVNPIALLGQVDHVYTATSQLGFEALMVGKPVTCFGVPFYAGWGATDDRVEVPRRCHRRSTTEIFAAAYLLYASYVHPDTGERCDIEEIIEHLERQRYWFERNQGNLFAFGFSRWKQGIVRDYLRAPGNRIRFVRSAAHAERLGFDRDSKLIVWGTREDRALQGLAARYDVPIWRMEDGFLRSVELGSAITAPASLVLDTSGIYYDPSRPSDLETALQEARFTKDELRRAAVLRKAIIDTGVSKYNIDSGARLGVPGDSGKKGPVILAVGQVDGDASIRLGCPDVRSNTAFLRAIRANNPDAYVIYKPHPDLIRHHRRGWVVPHRAAQFCDEVVKDVSLDSCLRAADEVHVRTSLVGFEALLRGLHVVVYGQPFYSGWGLTDDRSPIARRSRSLTLDALVAGVLIRYPRYLNTSTRTFTTAEYTISRLKAQRDEMNARGPHGSAWLSNNFRRLFRFVVGV